MTKIELANSLLDTVISHHKANKVTEYTNELMRKYNELCDSIPRLKDRVRLQLVSIK